MGTCNLILGALGLALILEVDVVGGLATLSSMDCLSEVGGGVTLGFVTHPSVGIGNGAFVNDNSKN